MKAKSQSERSLALIFKFGKIWNRNSESEFGIGIRNRNSESEFGIGIRNRNSESEFGIGEINESVTHLLLSTHFVDTPGAMQYIDSESEFGIGIRNRNSESEFGIRKSKLEFGIDLRTPT